MRYIIPVIVMLIAGLNMSGRSIPYRDAFTTLATANSTEWTDIRMPVSLKLESPANISISGNATIIRNKMLFISLRMLGFEVVQIQLTPDSIHAVDKIHKRYVAESVPELLRGVDLTLGNLQAMLTGMPFKPGSDSLTPDMFNDYSISAAGDDMPDLWVMSTEISAASHIAECSWVVDGIETPVMSGMLVSVPDMNREAMIYYSDNRLTPAGTMSSQCRIKASTGSKDMAATIIWNLDKAKWDTGETPVLKIPGGAKRISASQLLGAIENL